MFFKNKLQNKIIEENIIIKNYKGKISKKLDVFYNPLMKLNRDLSILVINNYFTKKINFCDPMAATGIRELRLLKLIPNKFNNITIGDISKKAIKDIKKNLKLNKIKTNKVKIIHDDAINIVNRDYYDYIEIDPFGSPIPFLDIACQKIKHKGIISVTATDTAGLCGSYPKTTFRKYGIKIYKTFNYDELGLRNLIAYCIRQGAKYDKQFIPILSYSKDHYYKIFFKVENSKTKSFYEMKDLAYINYNKTTQEIVIDKNDNENSIGKTYVKSYNDKDFILKLINNLDLIQDNKQILKLLNALYDEEDIIGYYNIHKLQKYNNFSSKIKFEDLFKILKNKKYKVSKYHNDNLSLKTNANYSDIINIMKKFPN